MRWWSGTCCTCSGASPGCCASRRAAPFRGEDLGCEDVPSALESVNNGLGELLFQPIAGDAAGTLPEHAVDGLLGGLQFGMLDLHGLERLSVVVVSNGACARRRGLFFLVPLPRPTSNRGA